MSRAQEIVERFAVRRPFAVRLAEAVSLAVLVDPPLLRKARLDLVPEADPGAEADLWLSPLVQTRGPDGLVFSTEIAEALRSRLAMDAARLDRAWRLTEVMHRHLTPPLRLEEEIAWLSVSSDPGAADRIEELLRSALAALVVGERRGLAHWAARALPKLPSKVRSVQPARMLEVGAHLRLYGTMPLAYTDEQAPEWLPWVIPTDVPQVSIGVRLYPEAIELDGTSADAQNTLRLPRTDPLWVELSWQEPSGSQSVQVTFRAGEKVTVPVTAERLRLRVLSGMVYQLSFKKKTDFFIGYAQADHLWAEWIAWVLEQAGYTTIMVAEDLQHMPLDRVIRESTHALCVLSPDYPGFDATEWAQHRTMLPVRVREVEEESFPVEGIYVDLVGLRAEAAQAALLDSVTRLGLKPSTEPRLPDTAAPSFPLDLAALPEKKIPEPGPLPPGSRMPFSINPLFAGRDEGLRKLARQLKVGETTAIGAIAGLAGIGKTQLAVEFVYRYGRYFEGGVFWASFADPSAIPAEIADCGRGLQLHPEFDSLPLEQQVRLTEEAWRNPIARLLVFDDCEDEELLERWRPPFGGARVLVTSRRAGWQPSLGVKEVELGVLSRKASVDLLRRFRPDLQEMDPNLDSIAAELDDLPLALHLAGSFLKQYARKQAGQPEVYLAALREHLFDHRSLQESASKMTSTGHEAHVGRAFALNFERLDPEDARDRLAVDLLINSAYFAPGEPIPRYLLTRTVERGEADRRESAVGDALTRLSDLGLLDAVEQGTLVVHRLVAAFAINLVKGIEVRDIVEQVVLEEARRLNRTGIPGPLLAWQPHLRAVTERASEREDLTAAELCSELGEHLWIIGDYREARPYLERALGIREKILGSEHPDTARSLNNLGLLLGAQGDLAGARPYYERALAINERVLGPEHPDTALSLNNLGLLLRDQGDLAGARPYSERALVINERVLGPEHPDTALSLNNLGFLLRDQGDLAGARRYLERALAIREKILGPEHPDTARSLNDLGLLLGAQGDLAGARQYFEQALRVLEARLGSDHPSTKIVRENLDFLESSEAPFTV